MASTAPGGDTGGTTPRLAVQRRRPRTASVTTAEGHPAISRIGRAKPHRRPGSAHAPARVATEPDIDDDDPLMKPPTPPGSPRLSKALTKVPKQRRRPAGSNMSPVVWRALVIATRAAQQRVRDYSSRQAALMSLRPVDNEDRQDVKVDRFLQRIETIKNPSGGGALRTHAGVPRTILTSDDEMDMPTDPVLRRRERIRRRTMEVEKGVCAAKQRLRRMRELEKLEDLEIDVMLKEAKQDECRREQTAQDAVHRAKQRIWMWRTKHRGDDADQIYKYKPF